MSYGELSDCGLKDNVLWLRENSRLNDRWVIWLNRYPVMSFHLNGFLSCCRTTSFGKVHIGKTHYCSIRPGIFLLQDNISCTGHSFSSHLQWVRQHPSLPIHHFLTFSTVSWWLPGAQRGWLMSFQPPPSRTRGLWYPSRIRGKRLQIPITAPGFNYSHCLNHLLIREDVIHSSPLLAYLSDSLT